MAESQSVARSRLRSRAEVLKTLLAAAPRPLLREEIADATGLARMTVNRIVGELAKQHQAVEAKSARRGSRTAQLVGLRSDAASVYAVEFLHDSIKVGRADLLGQLQGDALEVSHPVDADAHGSFDHAAEKLLKLAAGRPRGEIVGVGIAVAGPIDPSTRSLREGMAGAWRGSMVDWLGLDPGKELRDRLPEWQCPFVVGNDANFGAVAELIDAAEKWQLDARTSEPLRDVIFVKWASGIGCGIVIDGQLHTGQGGMAGEVGHAVVPDVIPEDAPSEECPRCGDVACLENVASTEALAARLGLPEFEPSAFVADERAQQALRRVALYIGRALAPAVNVLNPQLIVLAGIPSTFYSLVAPDLQRGLREGAVEPAFNDVEVQIGETAPNAILRGAIRQVLAQESLGFLMSRAEEPAPASRATSEPRTRVSRSRSGNAPEPAPSGQAGPGPSRHVDGSERPSPSA